MKVSIRKKKAAAFELLCDTMTHRECSGCGKANRRNALVHR